MIKVLLTCLALAAAAAGAARAADMRYETQDWILVAPEELGTPADLELNGRGVQLCTDELKRLTGYRPTPVPKFTMQWVQSGTNVSGAMQNGVFNWYVPGFRLVDPAARSFRESVISRGVCFGPHEVAHVLTWDSFRFSWANEGFATFTDRLYESASWRCCSQPTNSLQTCDETGFFWAGQRYGYSNLSRFGGGIEAYNTAACFWWEIHRIGGFPAVRALLASMRADPPFTTAELVVQHANVIAGADIRQMMLRYGFTAADLDAVPSPSVPRVCTRLGTDTADVLGGTAGSDVLCGAGGADRLTGLGGADVFRAGAGNDVLVARDGVADAVACGPGRDTVTADRRDRVNRDCERVRRR